jgi:hypothetical protein
MVALAHVVHKRQGADDPYRTGDIGVEVNEDTLKGSFN